MSPNISNKSIYIIFIMSINIVSMVCFYQPILNKEVKDPIFIYRDYMDEEESSGYVKLDIKQFYDSFYSPQFLFPRLYNQPLDVREKRISNYCDSANYVPFQKFKKMYQTLSLGRFVMKLRLCLKEETNPFDKIRVCCKTNLGSNNDTFIKCLDTSLESTQKSCMNKCFEKFINSYKDIFDEDHKDFLYTFDDKKRKKNGEKTLKLFNTTTNLEDRYYEFDDDNMVIYTVFFQGNNNIVIKRVSMTQNIILTA
ncbi:uncharacterized protein LOC132920639 isoform X2 [Rhopalosiphum padi]|uniref:uncharacterized protein LOC132920639 isoform X2 n=1 Tax=Rhopalosiphum padi TaxID=40932 RepID=UPI00298E0D81|nr:uncharacterized protein LOC132920639 isoform X2 [Rhopalosiphum padi]